MFNSCYYNLRNPAFLDDIGESQLSMMMPLGCGMPYDNYPVGGFYPYGDMAGININNGQPARDNFNGKTRAEKDANVFKNILKLAAIGISAFFLYKGGKKAYNFIKDKFFTKAKP